MSAIAYAQTVSPSTQPQGSTAGADVTLQRDITDAIVTWLDYLRRRDFSPFTLRQYASTLNRFCKATPGLQASAISPHHIEEFIFRPNIGAYTAQTELMILSSFCRWLLKRGVLPANPCKEVDRPRPKHKRRPAPSFTEFLAIRRACKTIEEAAVVETFYFTGLRKTELRCVPLRDLDLRTRRVRVVGKGEKERTVVFPARVRKALRAYLKATAKYRDGPDGPLFIRIRRCYNPKANQHGWVGEPRRYVKVYPQQPLGRGTLESMLARLGREVGLPYRLGTHILRHGFFRLLKVRGVPLEVASRLGGHSDIGITARIYGDLSDDDLARAYDKGLSRGVR